VKKNCRGENGLGEEELQREWVVVRDLVHFFFFIFIFIFTFSLEKRLLCLNFNYGLYNLIVLIY